MRFRKLTAASKLNIVRNGIKTQHLTIDLDRIAQSVGIHSVNNV